jgi:inosine-uridine nucleoside N-ribohydrolase
MPKKEYVWLDCDPGIDDALAIILAYFSPNIELLGLSTVAGNCSLERATVNALNVLNIAGKIRASEISKQLHGKKDKLEFADCLDYGGLSIPVVLKFFCLLQPIICLTNLFLIKIKGCAKSLIGENKFALEIHGDNGLHAQFPPTPEHALNFVNALSSQSTHFTALIYEYFKSLDKKITILAIGLFI